MKDSVFKTQLLPISLTVVVFLALTAVLWLEAVILNRFTSQDIVLQIRWSDILIGLTIYLKTAIDFAIYIANLMDRNPGWKSRISIEIGTAVGNAAGTLAILILWAFFKEVDWLLAFMVVIASLVLFRLAQDGLEHANAEDDKFPHWFRVTITQMDIALQKINSFNNRFLKFLIPHVKMTGGPGNLSFWPLFKLSFTVPFILGLDDFAGYVPLFNIINVFGFAIGVFAGHMILNSLLYISPLRTVKAVKNPVISFIGSLFFIGLAIYGLIEAYKLLFLH
jgi:hypothetical protein